MACCHPLPVKTELSRGPRAPFSLAEGGRGPSRLKTELRSHFHWQNSRATTDAPDMTDVKLATPTPAPKVKHNPDVALNEIEFDTPALYGEAVGPECRGKLTLFSFFPPVLVDYTPHLTSEEMEGKITTSTFALQQPRCVFNDPTDVIWLVVAHSEAVKTFNNSSKPEDLPYQSFAKNYFYMTLNTTASNYPCPKESDDITVLRVGSETKCVMDPWRPDCNGPLPDPGPYRVRFLAMNSASVVKETKWSDPITLIRGRDPGRIVAKPGRRRIETSIIITILSILSATLLAALIAAFIYKYSNICEKPMVAEFAGIQDPTIVRYTTHKIHDPLSNK